MSLKPGGLALVVGLKNNTKYNGMCVYLVEFVKAGDWFKSPTGRPLNCFASEDFWVTTGNFVSPDDYEGWAVFRSKNLMPIDGADFTEEMGALANEHCHQ